MLVRLRIGSAVGEDDVAASATAVVAVSNTVMLVNRQWWPRSANP